MPNFIRTSMDTRGMRFAVVVARFNEMITDRLLEGALGALGDHDVAEEDIDVARVPGSFELGTVAMQMARSERYSAIICIGAVIRGETAHFDYVSKVAAEGVGRIGPETGVPAVFGVLTTDTVEQAMVRSATPGSNRGADAANAAIEMANLRRSLSDA
jgi:6,7-dimethyl-8-ribityllumazine synthase